MPINQLSNGVFYVSAPKTQKYQMSNAGNYTSVFTKGRADAFNMALDQAKVKIQNEQEAYLLQVKAYSDRAQALEKQLADLNAAKAKGDFEALREAYNTYVKESAAASNAFANRSLEATKQTYPIATSSSEKGSPYGAGVLKAGVKLGDKQEEIINEATTKAGGDVKSAIDTVNSYSNEVGILTDSTPEQTDAVKGKTLNQVFEQRTREMTPDQKLAYMKDYITEVNNLPGGKQYTDAWLRYKEEELKEGTGGDYSAKRTGTPIRSPVYTGTAIKGEVPTYKEDFKAPEMKIADEEAKIKQLLDNLKQPTAPGSDIITTARDIYAGRFGPPTEGSDAAYRRRLVADALLKMSPEKRTKALNELGFALPPAGQVAAPAAPSVAAPAASPVVPAPAAPAVTAPAPAPAASPVAPAPGPTLPSEPSKALIRRGFLELPTSMEASSPLGQALQSSQAPLIPSERNLEMSLLGMAPPAGPTETPAPVAPIIPPTENNSVTEAKPPTTGAKVLALPKASPVVQTEKGKRTQYLQQVFADAKDLLSKPKQLERVIASGVGKQAAEIYNGNRITNKGIKQTMEQITVDFSDSPEDRRKAHAIVIALDLKNKDSQKLPQAEV